MSLSCAQAVLFIAACFKPGDERLSLERHAGKCAIRSEVYVDDLVFRGWKVASRRAIDCPPDTGIKGAMTLEQTQ